MANSRRSCSLVGCSYRKYLKDDISWSKFKELFEEQLMPTAGRTRLYRDFLDLKQGSMSVSEYENKFNELSC